MTPVFQRAICRRPGPDFAEGLTTARTPSHDYRKMLAQHDAYVEALEALGLSVQVLDPLPGHPDGYFVEDTAVIVPEVAILARPGAAERRGETLSMAPVLAEHLPIERIEAPGSLDGGDVLLVGRRFFIGLSARTNREGAEQLGRIVERHGYTWCAVPVDRGLHFKSSVNWVGGDALLLTESFSHREELRGYEHVVAPAGEEYAANTLWLNGTLLVPSGYPKTRARLERLGLPLVELDTSEARGMDGGLTCMSLRF